MRITQSHELSQAGETQLEMIRDLMLALSRRGAWLTLGEISEQTEIGEASISAQLRHLRKTRHGRYRVEKRHRRLENPGKPGENNACGSIGLWEYQVLSPNLSDGPGMTDGKYKTESSPVGEETANNS